MFNLFKKRALYHVVCQWNDTDNIKNNGSACTQFKRFRKIKSYNDINEINETFENFVKEQRNIKNVSIVITNIIRLD